MQWRRLSWPSSPVVTPRRHMPLRRRCSLRSMRCVSVSGSCLWATISSRDTSSPAWRRRIATTARRTSLDAQPACEICEQFFEGGGSVDPRELYRSLGGHAAIRFALWRDGWSASENLSVFFPAAALVLDPRARTFSAAPTPNGMLVVGVTGDSTARFDGAVRWPRGSLDPRQQLWVEIVLPPGQGYPHLYDVREGRDVTVAYPLAVAQRARRVTARRLRLEHVSRVRPRVPRGNGPAGPSATDPRHASGIPATELDVPLGQSGRA